MHLCRRAGCCQAGLGTGTVSLALNMRARSMAFCMVITHDIKNDASMKACATETAGGSAPRFYENHQNRWFSESEAQSSRT